MALLADFIMGIIILVMRLLCLSKMACWFGLETCFIVTHTWFELVRTSISIHMDIVWRILVLIYAFISFPRRVLTALQRERQLEVYLQDMQIEMENLVWDKKELEKHLQTVIKENKMMQLILGELEEEHNEAITKIELLEHELQDLKYESPHLTEIQGKLFWSHKGQDDTTHLQTGAINKYNIPYGNRDLFQDSLMQKSNSKSGTKTSGIHSMKSEVISMSPETYEAVDESREFAISRSTFSAILSLLVGVIVWVAEDPCMPLVIALFTVVCMSMKSVVQFFSTIKNKPVSDAVALLSFNWFLLGMLAYPTLPKVSQLLGPLVKQRVSSLGLSNNMVLT